MGMKLESRLPHQIKAIELINQVSNDVKIYKLNLKDFISFVDDLKQREKFGNIHTIDSFDRSIKRELEYRWKY